MSTYRKDISDEVELRGRSNPWGWSAHDVFYQGQRIGGIYCGFPESRELWADGFDRETVKEADGNVHLYIYDCREPNESHL